MLMKERCIKAHWCGGIRTLCLILNPLCTVTTNCSRFKHILADCCTKRVPIYLNVNVPFSCEAAVGLMIPSLGCCILSAVIYTRDIICTSTVKAPHFSVHWRLSCYARWDVVVRAGFKMYNNDLRSARVYVRATITDKEEFLELLVPNRKKMTWMALLHSDGSAMIGPTQPHNLFKSIETWYVIISVDQVRGTHNNPPPPPSGRPEVT